MVSMLRKNAGVALAAVVITVAVVAPVRAQVDVGPGTTGGVVPFAVSFSFNPQESTYQTTVPAGYVLILSDVSGDWATGSSKITPFLTIAFGSPFGHQIALLMSQNQLSPATSNPGGAI